MSGTLRPFPVGTRTVGTHQNLFSGKRVAGGHTKSFPVGTIALGDPLEHFQRGPSSWRGGKGRAGL